MATWPATLPQAPLADGYQEAPHDATIRTAMDVGPAKLRRRSTVEGADLRMLFVLSSSQVSDLDTFYSSTLSGGVDAFDWTDPRLGTSESYRFAARPAPQFLGGDWWRVELQLERLP